MRSAPAQPAPWRALPLGDTRHRQQTPRTGLRASASGRRRYRAPKTRSRILHLRATPRPRWKRAHARRTRRAVVLGRSCSRTRTVSAAFPGGQHPRHGPKASRKGTRRAVQERSGESDTRKQNAALHCRTSKPEMPPAMAQFWGHAWHAQCVMCCTPWFLAKSCPVKDAHAAGFAHAPRAPTPKKPAMRVSAATTWLHCGAHPPRRQTAGVLGRGGPGTRSSPRSSPTRTRHQTSMAGRQSAIHTCSDAAQPRHRGSFISSCAQRQAMAWRTRLCGAYPRKDGGVVAVAPAVESIDARDQIQGVAFVMLPASVVREEVLGDGGGG